MSGVVALVGRGRLTLSLVHGEPLFVHAARALVEALGGTPARVTVLTDHDIVVEVRDGLRGSHLDVPVQTIAEWRPTAGRLMVHDPLCPLTPSAFLADLATTELAAPAVMGYRPVTDTIKTVVEEKIAGTVDREALAALTSPAVVTVTGDETPPLADFGGLLEWLRARGPVRLVRSPAMGRRVDDDSSINLLECVDELGHQLSPG